MSLIRHTAPTGAVINLSDAKAQLRVTNSAEDAAIASMVAAAADECEHLMGRALLQQKWQLTLDAFVTPLLLQRPPVTAIDSVKYVHATTGVLTTLDPSAYQLAKADDYLVRLVPAFGTSWPSARCQAEAVQVVFTCGYATALAVPENIKRWILVRVGAYYKHREAWTAGYAIERNEHIDSLLDRHRAWIF